MADLPFRVGTELTHALGPPHPGSGRVSGHKEHPRCLPLLTLLRDLGWLDRLDLFLLLGPQQFFLLPYHRGVLGPELQEKKKKPPETFPGKCSPPSQCKLVTSVPRKTCWISEKSIDFCSLSLRSLLKNRFCWSYFLCHRA